jgi:3-oxoadipate enol-lactonase
MTTVTLPSGAQIWYRKLGQGTPLLQIHGTAFGHRNFELMTPLMQPHFEVIDFDLPGFGESRNGPIPPTNLEGLADLVAELIVALGYPRISIHGTSFGAMIGLTLAARHPELIDRLVLSCFLARYDNAARMMRQTWKRAALESGMEAVADMTSVAGFARSYYDRPGAEAQFASMRLAFSKNEPAAFVAGTEMLERTDLSAYVPKVTAKTLILAGAEDNMTPFRPSDSGVGLYQIEKMLPRSQTVVIQESGHYLVIEQPEVASGHIVKFMAA